MMRWETRVLIEISARLAKECRRLRWSADYSVAGFGLGFFGLNKVRDSVALGAYFATKHLPPAFSTSTKWEHHAEVIPKSESPIALLNQYILLEPLLSSFPILHREPSLLH